MRLALGQASVAALFDNVGTADQLTGKITQLVRGQTVYANLHFPITRHRDDDRAACIPIPRDRCGRAAEIERLNDTFSHAGATPSREASSCCDARAARLEKNPQEAAFLRD